MGEGIFSSIALGRITKYYVKGHCPVFTRLFSLGKILGGKRGECHDMKKPASATVMRSAKAEMFYRGETMFYKLT